MRPPSSTSRLSWIRPGPRAPWSERLAKNRACWLAPRPTDLLTKPSSHHDRFLRIGPPSETFILLVVSPLISGYILRRSASCSGWRRVFKPFASTLGWSHSCVCHVARGSASRLHSLIVPGSSQGILNFKLLFIGHTLASAGILCAHYTPRLYASRTCRTSYVMV